MKSYYSEFLGTCFLLIAIVGSGMMGQKMTNDFGIILLANSIAIGFALIVLIIVFADISGAHFNPVVSISMYLMKEISFRKALIYILIQLAGAIVGVMLANKMFGFSAINESMNERSGVALFISEIISTFGLLLVIFGTKKKEKIIVALCVGMYISSAIWFSSSTSFANPAVSIARTLTDSFTGSRMQDMPFFIFAQIIGTIVATFFIGGWLFKKN
jgi:glycerol uptake facilitator-like aquaporin